jgi:hypothetical protein
MIQTPFFWLLFMRAMADLAKEDTRSAVLNAYSAWDTFVTRACALLLDDLGAGEAWKALPGRLQRAEPISGMFAGLYTAKVRAWPQLVKSKTQEIRNGVIHGDDIPTHSEALDALEDVLACMRAFDHALPQIVAKDDHGDAARARLGDYGRQYLDKTNSEGWTQMMTVGYAVNLNLNPATVVDGLRKGTWPAMVSR